MNLGRQIESLLRKHPSVFVKGLGVFRRIHQSALYDSNRNVYLPPVTSVEFDYFEIDGFDFIEYIQQVNLLERSEAEQKLEELVSITLDSLSLNSEVLLDGLGTLVSFGNAYIFTPIDLNGFLYEEVESSFENRESLESTVVETEVTPDIVINTDTNELVEEVSSSEDEETDALSLDSIDETETLHQNEVNSNITSEDVILEEKVLSDVVEENIIVTENVVELNNDPVESKVEIDSESVSSSLPLTKEIYESQQFQSDFEENTNEGRSYIYGLLAAIFVMLLAGVYYYITTYRNGIVVNSRVVPSNSVLPSNLPIDTALRDTVLLSDSVLLNQDTVVNPTVAEIPKSSVKKPIHKYTIVIATHHTLEKAELDAKKYNKEGHSTVRVLIPNLKKNKKRVIWDTYETKEQRDSALRVVRSLYKEDAWGSDI